MPLINKRTIKGLPVVRQFYPPVRRLPMARKLITTYMGLVLKWLTKSREFVNFTYNLTEQNHRELAHFISNAFGADLQLVSAYVDEIISDRGLRRHISERTLSNSDSLWTDAEARYGRRIGWYALARLLKPKIVVESGVDKGLGTCVLAAAMLRNREEGDQGRVYGIDINPHAGWLVAPPYLEVVKFVLDDSHAALQRLEGNIDMFVHDSEHSYEHEAGEYAIIRDRLSEKAVILSDNAHSLPTLMDFAEANGLRYYFWKEKPKDHFYPGAGIGMVMFDKRSGEKS